MLKVLIIARSTLYTIKGGDTVQITETARYLKELGVDVSVARTDQPIDYPQYDLLHFFNIIRPADILFHVKKSKKPFVLSPILVDYSEFDRFHRLGVAGKLFRFLSGDNIEYTKAVGRWILGKDRLMSVSYLWKGQSKSVRELLSRTEMLLPNSISEYKRLLKRYSISCDHSVIVNGIDTALFRNDTVLKKDAGLVICVARVEGIKNQLNLIRAMNNTRYRLFIIGAPAPNQKQYYDRCKALAASNVRFIDHVPQKELVAFYRRAAVHALPSWFETTGLSSLEAGAMNCNLVITSRGDTRDYFGDHAFYCDPASPESIYNAVDAAARGAVSNELQKKISEQYTWQKAAEQTLSAYQKICFNKC